MSRLVFIILLVGLGCKNDQVIIPNKGNNIEVVLKEIAVENKEKKPILNNYSIDDLLGKVKPSNNEDFVKVPIEYCSRNGFYLRKETFAAYVKMYKAAIKDGVELKIISATRNFNRQKSIWERKWNGQTRVGGKNLSKTTKPNQERALKILEFSSMPGTSRHHWGTDMDIYALTNKQFESGKGLKIYNWLTSNAAEYGFCQPYSPKGKEGRPWGYNEEKWHWSYLPVANQFMNLAERKLENKMIVGFDGSNTAEEIDIKKKYIFGINKECK